jgi:hypothetical protein
MILMDALTVAMLSRKDTRNLKPLSSLDTKQARLSPFKAIE